MNVFQIGDPIPKHYNAHSIGLGRGRAYPSLLGIPLVARVERPTPAQVAAVNRGAVTLGARYRRGGESALILQVGEPGSAEALEIPVDAGSGLDGWETAWWGEDIELALCDETTKTCATTEFVGPGKGLGDRGVSHPAVQDLCTAVFPEQRYGLVQPRGLLDADAWVASAQALVRAAAWEPGFSEVWDVREVDEIVLTASDIARMLRLEDETKQLLAGSCSYVVMPPRQALTVAAKFYARLVRGRGRQVVVCRSAEEAAEHLGIEKLPVLQACGSEEAEG